MCYLLLQTKWQTGSSVSQITMVIFPFQRVNVNSSYEIMHFFIKWKPKIHLLYRRLTCFLVHGCTAICKYRLAIVLYVFNIRLDLRLLYASWMRTIYSTSICQFWQTVISLSDKDIWHIEAHWHVNVSVKYVPVGSSRLKWCIMAAYLIS